MIMRVIVCVGYPVWSPQAAKLAIHTLTKLALILAVVACMHSHARVTYV